MFTDCTKKTKVVCSVSLFSLICLLLPFVFLVIDSQPKRASDSVYCPLQKKWVKASQPQLQPLVNVFDRICAAETTKAAIERSVFGKLSPFQILSDAGQAETLIFAYLERGETAVREFRGSPLPSAPNKPFAVVAAEKSVPNFGSRFVLMSGAIARFAPLAPRPPTLVAFCLNSQFGCCSVKFSPNLSPRPPPLLS
jgi:hypothetical protein